MVDRPGSNYRVKFDSPNARGNKVIQLNVVAVNTGQLAVSGSRYASTILVEADKLGVVVVALLALAKVYRVKVRICCDLGQFPLAVSGVMQRNVTVLELPSGTAVRLGEVSEGSLVYQVCTSEDSIVYSRVVIDAGKRIAERARAINHYYY